ncbi:hypothetical protein [Flectobacillus roseus]|uniref:hypothetical protein n=1 Tax=Flectobacillus roseus TaxID=502259 RepID=UPI0024B783AA|nr:hypothetical protein [Flectobacillus roseus]MDI9872184.1 hypothetical protein [Flectobacillus roseus]
MNIIQLISGAYKSISIESSEFIGKIKELLVFDFVTKCIGGFTIQELRYLSNAQVQMIRYFRISESGKDGWVKYSSTSTELDNEGDTIVTNSGLRLKRIIGDVVKPSWYKKQNESFWSNAVNKAINHNPDKTIFFENGLYEFDSKINLTINTKIKGENKRGVLFKYDGNDFLLEYLSPCTDGRDPVVGLSFSGFTCNAKNAIRINQEGDFSTIWNKQFHLKGLVVKDIILFGKYGVDIDPNIDTNINISQTQLESFGVGIKMSKVFDYVIESVQIEDFGCGVSLDGCDINELKNSRLCRNARHYYSYGHDTYGSQNAVTKCDLLQNRRIGAVFLKDTAFDKITDNYFETYSPAGMYIKTDGDLKTTVSKNRFDNTGQLNTKMLSFAPKGTLLFVNNITNPSVNMADVEVLETYYNSFNRLLAKWEGNCENTPIPQNPVVQRGNFDLNKIEAYNLNDKSLNGNVGFNFFPFSQSPVTNRTVFRTDVQTLYTNFYNINPSYRNYLIRITARAIAVGNGYHILRYVEDGVTTILKQGYLGFTKTTEVEVKEYVIQIPPDKKATGFITIEHVNTEYELERVECIPTKSILAQPFGEIALVNGMVTISNANITNSGLVQIWLKSQVGTLYNYLECTCNAGSFTIVAKDNSGNIVTGCNSIIGFNILKF